MVNRSRQGDLFYLLTLGEAERRRPATGVLRVQRLKAVLVEVVYDLPYPVGAGEAHLGDPGHVHALDRQQHHLRPPPGHHRPRRPAHYAQQPVPLFVRHLSGTRKPSPRHHTSDPLTPSQTRMRDRRSPGQVVDLEGQGCLADAALVVLGYFFHELSMHDLAEELGCPTLGFHRCALKPSCSCVT
jgi:hypothetical protein